MAEVVVRSRRTRRSPALLLWDGYSVRGKGRLERSRWTLSGHRKDWFQPKGVGHCARDDFRRERCAYPLFLGYGGHQCERIFHQWHQHTEIRVRTELDAILRHRRVCRLPLATI